MKFTDFSSPFCHIICLSGTLVLLKSKDVLDASLKYCACVPLSFICRQTDHTSVCWVAGACHGGLELLTTRHTPIA